MNSFFRLASLWLVLSLLPACTAFKNEPLTLRSEAGWGEVGQARWNWSTSGEVIADAGDGFLVSKKQYSDYEMSFEFSVDASTNSGVLIHCRNPEEITPLTCYEINIWDKHPQQENRTGAIVTRVPPFMKIDTLGRWNDYRIQVSHTAVVVYLNGVLVSSLSNPELTSGHIALQRAAGGTARFKNFMVSPLSGEL